jgi:mannose-6-phosphate isomerase-like protein (cupin superfamily)
MTEPLGMEPHRRYDASQGPRIIGPHDGKAIDLGAVGVRFLVWGEESGGGFSLVEHPIPPRHLASPVHRHSREDEYSYVLEGRLGAQLGDEVVFAEVGDLASAFHGPGGLVCCRPGSLPGIGHRSRSMLRWGSRGRSGAAGAGRPSICGVQRARQADRRAGS